ncbi:MAG: T9SS type A sorting domain-containing protein [Saprospiraceae bacterium]|nr:T9SS type A sorting domain-containing protein [Saprospiraceae bacterium]
MKTFLTSILLVFAIFNIHAQSSPEEGWVRTFTTPDHTIQAHADWLDMHTSPMGATAALGYYYADLQIDGGPLLENLTEDDYLFLVSYDGWMGEYQWHATISAQQGPLPFQFGQNGKVCGDAEGNVYVAGHFLSNTIVFDNNLTLEKSCDLGCEELFLAKYNSAGVFQWAKTIKAGNAASHLIGGLACDAEGNILLSGTYGGSSIDFGTPNSQYNNLPGNGFFLTRLNPNGEPLWVKFLDDASNRAEAIALETNASGNVFVTGRYGDGEIRLDADHVLPQYSNDRDWFLACYNLSGDVVWAKNLHSPEYLDVLDLSTDGNDRTYLVCDFSSELRSGPDQWLVSNEPYSVAVVSVSENVNYFPQFIEYENDQSYPITTVHGEDGYESHWSGGFYFGGDLVVNGVPLANEGCADLLLANATLSGDYAGLSTLGGEGCEGITNFYYGSGIDQDAALFSYVTGVYESGFNLGDYAADNSGLFLARLNTSIISTFEPSEFNAFDLSPNPNNGVFTLQSNSGNLEGILRVFDASGKMCFEKQINAASENLNLSLTNGIYLVSFVTPQGVSSKKMQVLRF